jgi:hypothetical protein
VRRYRDTNAEYDIVLDGDQLREGSLEYDVIANKDIGPDVDASAAMKPNSGRLRPGGFSCECLKDPVPRIAPSALGFVARAGCEVAWGMNGTPRSRVGGDVFQYGHLCGASGKLDEVERCRRRPSGPWLAGAVLRSFGLD